MIGTYLNVAAILAGGAAGLLARRELPSAAQQWLKAALGLLTVVIGLRLTWISLRGPLLAILKQVAIVILAMMLGRIVGALLGIQRLSNRVGRHARRRCEQISPNAPGCFPNAFLASAIMFCLAPLGPLGALAEGLGNDPWPLIIKAGMDGLTAFTLVHLMGAGVLLAALPVLAVQGTITLVCLRFVEPTTRVFGPADAALATTGLMIFSVALLMLGVRRIAVADYLPALGFAPLLAWLWR